MNTTTATTSPSNVHPIEFFIACAINLIEFIAWTINELAGHHVTTTQPTTTDHESMVSNPIKDIIDVPFDFDWREYVHGLTVKQLRKYTGITNSRVNKAQLIEAALTY